MKEFWYNLLDRSAKFCGPWLFVVVSRIIAAGFFVFSGRVPESRRFYAVLFPDKGRFYHLWCSFKQYQNFTTIHLDRFLTARTTPSSTSEGWNKLEAVIGKDGGILLMSHLGNWEMAAHLLKQQKQDLRLLLYMGVKEKEGIERQQKEELRRAGVTIIGADQEGNSPFSAVEGIRFLQSGGLVSMSGDVVWRSDQRKVRVSFLGREAWLPQAPYIFALVSGAPLFAFFTFRTGTNSYHFFLSDPIVIRSVSRRDREPAIARAAQQYADLLEAALREHPLEWYHFDRFISDRPKQI
ncbi:MAG: lysophospholipid acyltransferase family protein [Desulfobulbaceae bacterium]|nr:lysophospholipid acyltransferase family protein [Desulfobulbaceae bacterium]